MTYAIFKWRKEFQRDLAIMINFTNKNFSLYELKVSTLNRDLAYCLPRSRSDGEIFSQINAISRLSETIFSYEADAKMYYVIVLYTVIIIL